MIMKKNLERFFFDRATWMGKPLKSDDFDLVLTDHGVCFTYKGIGTVMESQPQVILNDHYIYIDIMYESLFKTSL